MATETLLEKLGYFQKRIEELEKRVSALENGGASAFMPVPLKSSSSTAAKGLSLGELTWTMAGGASLLPRVAAACFLLVVALILRTLTDTGVMGPVAGSLAGIGYAALLMALGWGLYAKGQRIAPVFPSVGAFLLLLIVIETHARFEAVSTPVAYLILLAGEFAVVGTGLRYRDSALIYLGTIGITLAGLSIDFPSNSFAFVGMLLLPAIAASYLAEYKGLAAAGRWWMLVLNLLFWLFWSFKLSVPLTRGEIPAKELAPDGFFPILALFFLFHLSVTFWRILKLDKPLGFYCGVIPTVNALCMHFAGKIVVSPGFGSLQKLGWASTSAAMLHFAGAAWLAGRKLEGAPGVNAFAAGGSLLLALGASAALGTVEALPFLSLMSAALTVLAGRWRSGGTRLTSYLLQTYVMVTLASHFPSQGERITVSIIAALSLAITAFVQYHWCREHRPDRIDSAWFAWLDRRDITAVVLLLSGLVGAFGVLRAGLFLIIQSWTAAETAFFCGQSLIINVGAMALLAVSFRTRDREILTVALSVLFLAAVKVFLFDLLKTRGIPLVLSVFVFGLAALVASLVLARWQSGAGKCVEPEADGQMDRKITLS